MVEKQEASSETYRLMLEKLKTSISRFYLHASQRNTAAWRNSTSMKISLQTYFKDVRKPISAIFLAWISNSREYTFSFFVASLLRFKSLENVRFLIRRFTFEWKF